MPDPPLQLPPRATDSHKGTYGRVLLIGGSRGMSGSIALSSIAALHTGSGLVTAFIPDRCLETVAAFHPGVMTIPGADDAAGRFRVEAAVQLAGLVHQPNAIGCGPGITTEAGSIAIVERLLQATNVPRVFDADAINTLAILDWNKTTADNGPIIITPHPGEFERLTNVSATDRNAQLKAAVRMSKQTGVIIVLKGGPTVVVGPEHQWTNTTGNPGMATAGSGDLLTGVITSLLGQGLSTWDAARLGVWIHGLAGDLSATMLGQAGMTCQELQKALPNAVQQAQTCS